MTWTRANHLKSWANVHDARNVLPLFVRRLIRAVVPQEATVNFPAMEQVQRPGLDGIVEVSTTHQFVPNGKSAWEVGVNSNKTSKADKDFKKRTRETAEAVQKEATFVFVTPREWRKKDVWAEKKKSASQWKDVLVLDANDLEHWIELCPAVDAWFSTLTGHRPPGILDLESRWQALSRIAEHTLTPDVVICGRESTREELLKWLESDPSSLLLRAESTDDGLDFLAAMVSQKSGFSNHVDHMFVIDEVEAWRKLAINREPLVMVAKSSLSLDAADTAEAVSHGHHVLIVGNRSAGHFSHELDIPRQSTHSLAHALKACGFDDATADNKARACCGSSTVLKRLLTRHAHSAFPEWSQSEHRSDLAPFVLIGGWLHVEPVEPQSDESFPTNPPIDLMCLEEFTGLSRRELEVAVARWSDCDQPLFLRFRNNIVIASREDAWYLLASAITPQTSKRFEDLALRVLTEDDPALELEEDQRWLANIHGKTHSLSGEIRQGILETLVLMATYPISGTPAQNVDFHNLVRRILGCVLPQAATWQRWATFRGTQLSLFAEVDPDFFLSRIETDLETGNPQIPHLFLKSETDVIRSRNYHCGLLWALEVIAWSPGYLNRVTRILGKLSDLENTLPQNTGNRPSATLKNIYLWWLPHTNASIDQRMVALRQLVTDLPVVGRKLLAGLLPSFHGVSDPSVKPRWRDWALGWTPDRANQDSYRYAAEIAALVVEVASDDPVYWSQILDGVFRSNTQIIDSAIDSLKKIASTCTDVKSTSTLWNELDDLISRHEAHPDAKWTFPTEILNRLKPIRDDLTPDDPVILHRRLFDAHPELPDVDISQGYEEYQRELDTRRMNALSEICTKEGFNGIDRLLNNGASGDPVGWIIGREGLLEFDQMGIPDLIESGKPDRVQLAASFVAGLFNSNQFTPIESKVGSVSTRNAAFILCAVPFDRQTWDWIEHNCIEEVQDAYWGNQTGILRDHNPEDLNYVVRKLLLAKRPFGLLPENCSICYESLNRPFGQGDSGCQRNEGSVIRRSRLSGSFGMPTRCSMVGRTWQEFCRPWK